MSADMPVFSVADIRAAQVRLAGNVVVTPLMENAFLNDQLGGRVFLKCENLQRTGSFKFRGAYHTLTTLRPEERARGIVAVSSGNHAQGVAEAARLFGVPATIVMPKDAPSIKSSRVERSGATIIFYDRYTEDRVAIAQRFARKTGAIFVHPFDDLRVVAGQGTAGLESIDQLPDGLVPDTGLICCGGGGLCAGVSTAWRAAFPDMEIVAVEPDDFDDTRRSFGSGKREHIEPGKRSICDAILTEMPGEVTFPVNVANGVRAITVSDDEVLIAMAFALRELKIVLEPGGAVCLAALLAGKVDVQGRSVVALLSGGNTDPELIQRVLSLN